MADMTAIKGNLGKEIKYFPAEDGKPAQAYATVAVDKWEHLGDDENGKPVFDHVGNEWHNIGFTGNAAKRFHDKFQPGDSIVAFGNVTSKEFTSADGEVRESQTLWVKGFGPDAEWTKFTVQREPAADAEGGMQQQVQQQQSQAQTSGPAMTQM